MSGQDMPPTGDAAGGAPLPENPTLLQAIQSARRDLGAVDLRPLHRALLESMLMVPLQQPPQGDTIQYRTFGDDPALCVFTDEEHLRRFFIEAGQVLVMPVPGIHVCRMAVAGNLTQVVVNPASDDSYIMPPLVYRVMAEGLITGHVQNEAPPNVEVGLRSCPADPPEEVLDGWAEAVQRYSAGAVYWLGMVFPPNEMRYAVAVSAPAASMQALHNDLITTWLGAKLGVLPLLVINLDAVPFADHIREHGELLLFLD